MADTSTATRLPVDNAYDDLVRAEQVRMLYEGLLVSTIASTIGALLLVAVLWDIAPRMPTIIWFVVMAANQLWRMGLYFAYRRKGSLAVDEARRWGVYWTIGSGLSGCIWGAASFVLFVPGFPVAQAALVVAIFGVTSAAVLLTGPYLPAFYVFMVPTLAAIIVRYALEGDAMHYTVAGFAFISALAIFSFGRGYNRTLVQSLHNRFQNEALAQRLAQQNTELEAARRVAEDANRAKTQFFAAASHDLRQPLHAMGLFASALAGKVRDPEVRGVVASIEASVRALEGLFNELLDISRIDSGQVRVALRDFPAGEVLDRLRGEFEAEAAAKGLAFRIASTDAVIRSDPLLLERILRNLIANALRYTVSGEVAVTAERGEAALAFAVRDTGIGIPAADQQRIFEEFTQLQNPARTSRKGLGLGLSIVKRLCDLLGCAVHVASQPGQGSTFTFEVPLGSSARAETVLPTSPAGTRTDLTGRLVAVVDDEEAIVAGMTALLSGWGAMVIGSTDGHDVVARVQDAGRLPDLLIVDYRLAGSDTGIGVAQRLRQELDPEIPAVLITGSITPDLEAQARAAGLSFLLKPVSGATLARCIEPLLHIRLS